MQGEAAGPAMVTHPPAPQSIPGMSTPAEHQPVGSQQPSMKVERWAPGLGACSWALTTQSKLLGPGSDVPVAVQLRGAGVWRCRQAIQLPA